MKHVLLVLLLASGAARGDDWLVAQPGARYEFPRDHGVHRDFKTEWWYFTGDLRAADGGEFGYELTFFRQGVLRQVAPGMSRFVVPDFKFAHFTVSDIAGRRFSFVQKVARGAYGEAGFGDGSAGPLAWIEGWRLAVRPDGRWEISAANAGYAVDLVLAPAKRLVIEGVDGISRKAAGPGHASCYYSYTRMSGSGTLTLPGRAPLAVASETWFDHEWASNQLTARQAGWDWFSIQFADRCELMLYRMRLKDGGIDAASSGTFTNAAGEVTYLDAGDMRLTPLEFWKSPATSGNYPIRWRVEIPRLALSLEVSTPLKSQELVLAGPTYWEGLIHASGTREGVATLGHGYLELTGYVSELSGLK